MFSVRLDEAWPIMETLTDLLEHGARRVSSRVMSDYAREHITFVADVSSDGEWNSLYAS